MPKPKPNYATPLPQSSRSEILEWRFPKPYPYVLTGKSRAAWHTSFLIPQLNLLLDAGLCVNNLRPRQIFLTHGHSDHTLLAPAFVRRQNKPDIYCPWEMTLAFDNFILANTLLNLGGLVGFDTVAGGGEGSEDDADDDLNSTNPSGPDARRQNTHVTHGVRHGDIIPLPLSKGITATVFQCDHNVPCVGYVFSSVTQRLRPEFQGVPGSELARLRKSGAEITAAHSTPVFAFLGDTTAKILAAEPEWLREGIPVVITECSFLKEEHRAQAVKTKHTIWRDLEPVIRNFPRTTFVLTHFSLRYSEEDIRQFFEEMADAPPNIVVWIDGEPDES